jgi:hypothetical protein
MSVGRVFEAAVVEVTHESRVIDSADRTDAHGASRELPEIGHQPGVRIGAQTPPLNFLPVVRQLFLIEASFEEGARIDAGR